jgi:hypothetical protein
MSHARSRLLVLSLLVELLALVPLVHATPPDPVWISGSYDAGDLDEVLLGAISMPAADVRRTVALRVDDASPAPEATPLLPPALCPQDLPSRERRVPRGLELDADLTRAPPRL